MSTPTTVTGAAPVVETSITPAVQYRDYSSYRFRAEVDWIDLKLVTVAPTNFQTVRRRLGIGFAGPEALGAGGACTEFNVRFQEPKSWADIDERLKRLTVDHPLAEPPTVTGIEIALDAYSTSQNRDDLIAMTVHFYNGSTKLVSVNRRASKRKGESYYLKTRSQLQNLIAEGYNIYIGDQADAAHQHIYLKETDSSTALPPHQQRARTEFTLKSEMLPKHSFVDWQGHDFTKFASFFKFRHLKNDLSPWAAVPLHAMAQVGERRARKTPKGYCRAFSHATVADTKLNALAYDALRELTRRWRCGVKDE